MRYQPLVTDDMEIYLIIANPKKSNNLGPIVRCAAAFGVSQIILVGYEKFATDGAHGSHRHVRTIAFPTFDKAENYVRTELRCCCIVGLLGGVPVSMLNEDVTMKESTRIGSCYNSNGSSIYFNEELGLWLVRNNAEDDNCTSACAKHHGETPASSECGSAARNYETKESLTERRSYPVHCRPFFFQKGGPFCLVVSKDSMGLSTEQANLCDLFLHVPHMAAAVMTPSTATTTMTMQRLLNAPTCLSIVLHHYTAFAQCQERNFLEGKFQVSSKKVSRSEQCSEKQRNDRSKQREEERNATERVTEETLGSWNNLFDQD